MQKKNAFIQAVHDIFMCDDFLEQISIEGELYSCIISKTEETVVYGETGMQNLAPFTVILKLPLPRVPKHADKVIFNGNQYKVAQVDFDSAMASVTLHLETLSKGV